jgi:mono/diheme cytochrome c family protein
MQIKPLNFYVMPEQFTLKQFLRNYRPKRIMKISTKILALTVVVLTGCQGMPSEKPPVHVNPNMDWQEKFTAQERNTFFEDNRADRLPVSGTTARGQLNTDVALHEGLDSRGQYVARIPLDLSADFVKRGQQRYEIFCTPCHGGTGAGDGIVIGYGYVPPPSFYDERITEMPDGELYSAIYNGVRSMPSYRHQIPVEDRWAIVAYIRALQRSQNVREQDLLNLGLTRESISGLPTGSASAAAQ